MIDCPKCQSSLLKITRDKNKPLKPKQEFYYTHHFKCPDCIYQYMPKEEKVFINKKRELKGCIRMTETLLHRLKQLEKE